ncbi:MAG: TIGR01458 family HAD-type hydrolase [Verrucomicrobia bacterium]|nr:TIGR01458 family HAD-type hydrolase [Verrucomicrobiota bacterium]
MGLKDRLGGVLIDLDGTLIEAQRLIPGAVESIRLLRENNIPYRIITNTTSKPRSVIVAGLRALGFEVLPEEIITAPVVASQYLAQNGLIRCFPLMKPSLREDLIGIEFVDANPQAVLVGDLGDDLSYTALNRAFRFLLDGVVFVTMARNRYFRGVDGLCLDVGSIVAALEYATQRQATLIGKPAADFFLIASRSMNADPAATIMIGDDLEADVGGAMAAGFCGALVKTGKFRADQLVASNIRPNFVLRSIAEVGDLLS